jgi:hypothetical protein
MARRRGRDNRSIPTVDVSSEYLEVERRRYHERIRRDRVFPAQRTRESSPADISPRSKELTDVEQALEEAAPRLERKGWKVTRRAQ